MTGGRTTALLRRNSLTPLLLSSHTGTGEAHLSPSQRWDHLSPRRTRNSSSTISEATLMAVRALMAARALMASLRIRGLPEWRGTITSQADLLLQLPRSASSATSFQVLSGQTTPWVPLQATSAHTLLLRHTANMPVVPPTDHPCRTTRMECRACSLLRLCLTTELAPLAMPLASVPATPLFFDKTTATTLR